MSDTKPTYSLELSHDGAPPSVPARMFNAGPQPPSNAAHYLWLLRRHWWKCLAFIAASLVAAVVISSHMTPLYESTATVDIDRQMPNGIIGQEMMRPGGNDADQFLATQVKVIQSDSVLRKVALRFHLLDSEKGRSISTRSGPLQQQDTPIALRNLKVTRPPNTYLLSISYRSADSQLSADVANAVSNAYIDHMHDIQYRSSARVATFMERQLEELKAKMEHSSQALQKFEADLNIVNPEEKTAILSARLVQLNTEYTAAEADRVRKETSYRAVRLGSMEAAQVSSQGEGLKKLSERLEEAQQKFADVQAHFGSSHPEYKKAAAQVAEIQRQQHKSVDNIGQRVEMEYTQAVGRQEMLEKAVTRAKLEFDQLNAHSFEFQTLKHEAEADRKLYEELVRRIKEAGINAGFQSSAIRIADEARPAFTPVYPNKPLNLAVTFLLSSLFCLVVVVGADTLSNSVRDPEYLAHSMNTEVIGALPRCMRPKLLNFSRGVARKSGTLMSQRAADFSQNAYDSAIRSLRNSILLTHGNRRLRRLLVTSPAAGEGKSTIAMNLAIANAQQGYKTLLVDCDLRRPAIHSRAGVLDGASLANVLHGEISWHDALVKDEATPKLDMLLGNSAAAGDAELIGEALSGILSEAQERYDLVVLDSPPMLGFPEPLQMATMVDGVLMVAHAGRTGRTALAGALGTLTRLRATVVGIVLNEVCAATTETHSYYNPYSKYHKYYGTRV